MPTTNQLKARPAPLRPTINGLLPTDMAPSGQSYGQRIIEQVRAGAVIVNAARAAGVSMAQLGEWTREGQASYARYLAGADWATDFTPWQQDCVDFHTRLDQAMATHKVSLEVIAEQVARGGLERRRVRRRTVDGKPVEEVTVTESFAPNPEMLRWKLERLQPDVYGVRARLDVMVHDLTDSDDRFDITLQRVEAIKRARAVREAAIDTTATEGEA